MGDKLTFLQELHVRANRFAFHLSILPREIKTKTFIRYTCKFSKPFWLYQ